jgi:glycosyltransferase involved in cell wall biosynthesis
MSVYNGARFLGEAIDSIINQTFLEWELIVVDDASVDDTSEILAEYGKRDSRVRGCTLQVNQGAAAARNVACRQARAPLVAIMDADDVSLPERLATQVEYLISHPEISVVGSWVRLINDEGVVGPIRRYPTSPALVAWSLFFFNTLAHPTVMMRRTALHMEAVFDPQYRLAQDYALFTSLSRRVQMANIADVLVHYRTWGGNSSRKPAQALAATQIVRKHAEALGVSATDAQIDALQGLARDRYPDRPEELAALAQLIMRLRTAAIHSLPRSMDTAGIDVDAAVRLWQLAIQATRRAPRLSLSLARRAFVLSPRSVLALARKAFQQLRRPR